MKTVALISGGKDSCFNMLQCVAKGHEIVALANLKPADKDELDSYMYQTVGHHAIDLYAEAMGLSLYRHTIQGSSKETGRDYVPTQDDEVEDLYFLLKKVKDEIDIEAVSVGAILSDYQRVRVENVCQRLGLTSLSYLWRRNQTSLLNEMIQSRVSAVIIKVAAMGLDPDKHLGKSLEEMYPYLKSMETKYDLNVCGEGGEFETFTIDCPLFTKRIVLDDVEKVIHSDDAFAPVGYLNLKSAHLEDKDMNPSYSFLERIDDLRMKRSCNLLQELFSDVEIQELENEQTDVQNPCVHTNSCNDNISDMVSMTIGTNGNELRIAGLIVRYDENTSIQDLTKIAMDKLKSTLESCGDGWSLSHLVLVHLYVQDMKSFVNINSVYKQYFGLNPPARVCVETSLPSNVALQIDCYGCIDKNRHVMHVQSLSHWAPANIGPYSQAVQVNNKILVAGQIALCPATMKIIQGGIKAEARLSLRHVNRILAAMFKGCNICDVLLAVCYVTSQQYIDTARQEWQNALKLQQTEELGVESDVSTGFVEYVVIPKLPRDAKIEWQVYARTNSQTLCEEVETVTQNSCSACLRYKVTTDEDSSVLLTLSGTVEVTVDRKHSDLEKEAVRCFCDAYRQVIEKSQLLQSCLPLLRIFYPASLYKYDRLYSDFKEILQLTIGILPVFTLVPVIELSTPNKVLYICH